MDDGGGGVKAGCMRIKVPSPRRIVARWFSPHGKVKGKKTPMSEARVRDFDHCTKIITSSEENRQEAGEFSDSTPRTIDSELQRRELLFSFGVSCYLLHLIATGREETQKIVELRNDLDNFLECRKQELRRKQQEFVELRNDIEKFIAFHNDEMKRKNEREFPLFGKQQQQMEFTSAYSTTSEVVDGPESSTDHYYSPHILDTSMGVGGEDFGGEMDQLEAELEAEFELLQIGQLSSKLNEVSEKSDEDSQGVKFRHMCSGTVEEQQQGVCPYELERKLHELMESRQEEEIKELEIALEETKHRLHLKETEASWWKDTAYIVSERIPEPSRITHKSGTHVYPISR